MDIIKKIIRRFLYMAAPKWTTMIMSARARAHSHRIVKQWGCGPVHRKMIDRLGNRVLAGPFEGMVLTPMTHMEQIGPYLLGIYESELGSAWEIVLKGSYEQILDIGAKFGFYAVGLSRRFPNAEVVAFDTDWWARKAVQEMASANNTRNVKLESFCSPEWLVKNTRPGAFILSDCEGYESVLFTENVIPTLRSATLVIETHDCSVPGVSDRLYQAFRHTHTVKVLGLEESRPNLVCDLDFLSEGEKKLATQEVRPAQIWLLCLPKSKYA